MNASKTTGEKENLSSIIIIQVKDWAADISHQYEKGQITLYTSDVKGSWFRKKVM